MISRIWRGYTAQANADACEVLLKGGIFAGIRERGHTRLWKKGLTRPVMVPRHGRELKRGLLADIIKQAGLTQHEFRRLL